MSKDFSLQRGVVLLDKPPGLTSIQCTERVKKILKAEKAGHAGTLDPNATGVLLVALNESRKAMPLFMGLEKEYEGTMHLHGDIQKKRIESAFKKFTGPIIQTPPRRSAVASKPRRKRIHFLKISKAEGREIFFRVKCEAGTYIRKLVHDIGEELGCGAHMTKLRRTKIDGFSIKDCVKIEGLEKNPRAMDLEKALERIRTKKIFLRGSALPKILNGAPVRLQDTSRIDKRIKSGESIAVFYGKKIAALASAKTDFGKIKGGGSIARTERVFKY